MIDATEQTEAPPIKPVVLGPLPIPAAPPREDRVLYAAVLSLVAFGIVMVYSASAVLAAKHFGSPTYFLKRDLLYAGLGLAVMHIAMRIDFGVWRRFAYPFLALAFVLLAGVLVAGARINGARRWFIFAGMSFQPAELAKFALVIYLAYSLARKAEKVKSFTIGFVPHMIVASLMMGLILVQPDLGTACIIGMTTLLLLFVAGAKISYIIVAVLAAAPIVYQVIVGTPWRLKRMLAFLDPWQYRYDVGWQITESLIAVGSGGAVGQGLGDGKQKMLYLPECWTDYIMAIVGEELGFLGLLAVITVLGVILWRGVRAALRARDAFGSFLAFGITAAFGLQALVNIGVVLGSLPTKGLPMPFISYGGSTLIVDLAAVGVVLNVSNAAPEPRAEEPRMSVWKRVVNRRKRGNGRRVIVEA
jgi:cell division protein FtsW